MRVLSLAFCAPELVPHDMVAELETNILVEMLKEATTFANDVDLSTSASESPWSAPLTLVFPR